MTEEKSLDPTVADRIGEYVQKRGSRELLTELSNNSTLTANESAKAGLADMALLFDYLEAFGVVDKISLDMSLARGLDYYTGVIYEVITEGSAPAVSQDSEAQRIQREAKKDAKKSINAGEDEDRSDDPTVGVGSVAAGGRYDELVGMFKGNKEKGNIPCVGISFGVDRIFSITKARMEKENAASVRSTEVDVFVMAFGGKGFEGLLKERIEIARSLWDAGIKAEFLWKVKPKVRSRPCCVLLSCCRLEDQALTDDSVTTTIQEGGGRWRSSCYHSRRRRTREGASQIKADGSRGGPP